MDRPQQSRGRAEGAPQAWHGGFNIARPVKWVSRLFLCSIRVHRLNQNEIRIPGAKIFYTRSTGGMQGQRRRRTLICASAIDVLFPSLQKRPPEESMELCCRRAFRETQVLLTGLTAPDLVDCTRSSNCRPGRSASAESSKRLQTKMCRPHRRARAFV